MNITMSSPDGLGDFIMRMPMVQALLSEGHRLQLLMRSPAADLARDLFPEAQVHVIGRDPYHPETKKQRQPFRPDFLAIRNFGPDLYVAGAFQLTFFDEEWIRQADEGVPVAGFEAEEGRWFTDTITDPSDLAGKFALKVRVPIGMPEGEKYLQMAETLLGRQLTPEQPRPPTKAALEAATLLMQKHGLEAEKFLVICVGNRPGLVMKDWGGENWTSLLGEVAKEEPRTLLFLGNPKESASIERIRSALPAHARHLNLAQEPPSIAVSYALVSLGGGYLGRDSGVMHMAAATDRPLLALFGGVHWPRFLPQSAKGVVMNRATPCRGCNFICPFPEPYCITSIPVEAVLEEWLRIDEVQGLKVVELAKEEPWSEKAAEMDVSTFSWRQQLDGRRRWKEARRSRWWSASMSVFRRLFGGIRGEAAGKAGINKPKKLKK
jgi:ADP-heptose:LPS heptosyltransferase